MTNATIRFLTVAFWIAAVAVVAVLVHLVDVEAAARSAALIGWGFVPVVMIRVVLLAVDGHSWRCLIEKTQRPPVRSAMFQRWVGESVSTLMPFAVIGGELSRVRVMTLGRLSGALAFASVIVDGVVALISQFLFLCFGVAVFVQTVTDESSLTRSILVGGVALLIAAWSVWSLVRGGALGRLAGVLKKDLSRERVVWLAEAMGLVDRHISSILDDRAAVARAIGWRLVGWLIGASEIWLILLLVGKPVSFAAALVIDAITSAVRAAFFFVPGGLVVQEGAIVVVGTALGAEREAILVTALVKRAREISFSIPGLLAWNWLETRAIRQNAAGTTNR